MEIIDPESSGLTNEVSGRLSFFTRDEHEHKDDSSASALPTPSKVIQCLRDTSGFSRLCSLLLAPSLAPLSACDAPSAMPLANGRAAVRGIVPARVALLCVRILLRGHVALAASTPKIESNCVLDDGLYYRFVVTDRPCARITFCFCAAVL